jgi:hypothetical protein
VVSLSPEEKKELGRLRLIWGIAIAIVWIVFWHMYLNANHQAEVAKPGLFSGFWTGLGLFAGTVVAAITSPIGFVISHFLAKATIENQRAASLQKEALVRDQQAHAEEQARLQRRALVEKNDKQSRAKNARTEFIQRLGAVSDLLDLLAQTTDSERLILIEQNAKKELRELVAKYPRHELAALVKGDDVIQLKLHQIFEKMLVRKMKSDDAAILYYALTHIPASQA